MRRINIAHIRVAYKSEESVENVYRGICLNKEVGRKMMVTEPIKELEHEKSS